MKTTSATRAYWRMTIRELMEARLMPPQMDELNAVLDDFKAMENAQVENELFREALQQVLTDTAETEISAPVRKARQWHVANAALNYEQGPREVV